MQFWCNAASCVRFWLAQSLLQPKHSPCKGRHFPASGDTDRKNFSSGPHSSLHSLWWVRVTSFLVSHRFSFLDLFWSSSWYSPDEFLLNKRGFFRNWHENLYTVCRNLQHRRSKCVKLCSWCNKYLIGSLLCKESFCYSWELYSE